MPETYEKDGIIFFKEPYTINYLDWLVKHLDCDSIVTEKSSHANDVSILCYASSEQYNSYLRYVKQNFFPDEVIMRGIGATEVECID